MGRGAGVGPTVRRAAGFRSGRGRRAVERSVEEGYVRDVASAALEAVTSLLAPLRFCLVPFLFLVAESVLPHKLWTARRSRARSPGSGTAPSGGSTWRQKTAVWVVGRPSRSGSSANGVLARTGLWTARVVRARQTLLGWLWAATRRQCRTTAESTGSRVPAWPSPKGRLRRRRTCGAGRGPSQLAEEE